MTDMSTKVRKGYKGDASVMKPTMMCAVPLIMDRIYKNIIDSVEKRGPTFKKIFEFCFNYKLYWVRMGYGTPILDKIVFSKIKALLGGEMNFILVGGAPLSQTTHEFIRVCLGAIVVQGYSLTESTCTGTIMENYDISTGTVGRPMTGKVSNTSRYT
jgi:long-chain acyl-CoA synthetase